MQLDQANLDYIATVIAVAEALDIENIIIEPGAVRGVANDRSALIFHTTNVPIMPFGSIGINRTRTFGDRLKIAKTCSNFTTTVDVKDEQSSEPWAKTLTFKGKGISIEYRCANPKTIKAPKTFADGSKSFVDITPELLSMITKGKSAMKAETATIRQASDGVWLDISDINGDALVYQISTQTCSTQYAHQYNIDILTKVFKLTAAIPIEITTRGLIKATIQNITVFIGPTA